MVWVSTYIIIYALIAGWLYGYDNDETWFGVALLWPFVPFVAIILLIAWIGYKANKFLSR
jgi:hypothetical protein